MADLYGNTIDLQSVLTAVNDVKSEVDTQTDLIAQIATALEGKTSVSYPTLNNPATAGDIVEGREAIDADGNKIIGTVARAEGGAF